MKKFAVFNFLLIFITLITALVVSPTLKADSENKLSPELFRSMAFADQPLDLLLKYVGEGVILSRHSAWASLANAVSYKNAGSNAAAVAELQEILKTQNLPGRIALYCWNELRVLGINPGLAESTEILGVVVELKSAGSMLAAAYKNGAARHLNLNGRGEATIIVQDTFNEKVATICQQIIDDALPLISRSSPSFPPHENKNNHVLICLLTPSGVLASSHTIMSLTEETNAASLVFNRSSQLLGALLEAKKATTDNALQPVPLPVTAAIEE